MCNCSIHLIYQAQNACPFDSHTLTKKKEQGKQKILKRSHQINVFFNAYKAYVLYLIQHSKRKKKCYSFPIQSVVNVLLMAVLSCSTKSIFCSKRGNDLRISITAWKLRKVGIQFMPKNIFVKLLYKNNPIPQKRFP